MRIYVIEYGREGDQERTRECSLNYFRTRERLRDLLSEIDVYKSAADRTVMEPFWMRPQGWLLDIPCNCEGLIAALEGRLSKYRVKEI